MFRKTSNKKNKEANEQRMSGNEGIPEAKKAVPLDNDFCRHWIEETIQIARALFKHGNRLKHLTMMFALLTACKQLFSSIGL